MKRALTLLLLVACACGRVADEAVFTPFVYTDGGVKLFLKAAIPTPS